MFHYILNIRHRTAKDVLYEVFGKEEDLEMTKFALAYGGHYSTEQLKTLEKDKYSYKNVIRWWKCINPFKWLEAGFAFLFWGADELCQLNKEDGSQLSRANVLCILGRFFVYCILGLAEGLVKYLTSPFNQILKPIKRAWEADDKNRAYLWGGVAVMIAIFALFCVVCSFTGGAPLVPLIIAGLGYIANGVAGVLGGTLLATIAANVLMTYLALIIPQIIVQKFFNSLNIVIDFFIPVGGLLIPHLGGKGFDPKEAYVTLKFEKKSSGTTSLTPQSLSDPNSDVAQSTYLQFLLFNSPFKLESEKLGSPTVNSKPSEETNGSSREDALDFNANAHNNKANSGPVAPPSVSPHGATFKPQPTSSGSQGDPASTDSVSIPSSGSMQPSTK